MIDTHATINAGSQPEGTYWHFLAEDCRLGYDDGRKVVVGETLRVDETPILCKRGFHASQRAIDALRFARGPIVCLVTLGGTVLNETKQSISDKSVAQERTVLWMYNASNLLRHFACDVAEVALLAERKAGREPDARSFAVIEVMRRFMRGEASDSEWAIADTAADTAAANARISAWTATGNAVKSGASVSTSAKGIAWGISASARTAANAGARIAAWAAAGDTVRASVHNVDSGVSNYRLTRMLLSVMAQGKGEFGSSNTQK